jgi:hypothetical protein
MIRERERERERERVREKYLAGGFLSSTLNAMCFRN